MNVPCNRSRFGSEYVQRLFKVLYVVLVQQTGRGGIGVQKSRDGAAITSQSEDICPSAASLLLDESTLSPLPIVPRWPAWIPLPTSQTQKVMIDIPHSLDASVSF